MIGSDYMAQNTKNKLQVAELFAGVGGFRIGLERASSRNSGFEVVWSNQWEPSTKKQHASEVYVTQFGSKGHSNKNIAEVPTDDIPRHDLLVGGFPCQDYSVARNLSQAKGLAGKKGVLWWEIHRILKEKKEKKLAPNYLMLENVDRLPKSPAQQRGRDFAIMLASLSDLGYTVEWRVINAADYGMPQRRKRIFILGYKNGSPIEKEARSKQPFEWISRHGLAAKAFPVETNIDDVVPFELEGSLDQLTRNFGSANFSPFLTSGFMRDRKVWSYKITPVHKGERTVLKDILQPEKQIGEEFYISEKDLKDWKYLKGKKSEKRSTKAGFEFFYNEGPVTFPDALDKPSRTIITGEGGSTPSRFKHVIKTPSEKLRRLTPVELERLCMFPDNHTAGQPDAKRAFFMGNALVVGIIERLGKELAKRAL